MKRVILSIAGTIASLAALLGFKAHSTTQLATLPSASQQTQSQTPTTDGGSTIAATPQTGSTSSAPAPTAPSTSSSSSSSSSSSKKTVVGDAMQNQYGTVQVQVTVNGSSITNVQFVQLSANDRRSQEINSQAGPMLLQQTLDAQSANISGVSGATYTSDSYMQSLQSALDQL